jgi:hypothetical protein
MQNHPDESKPQNNWAEHYLSSKIQVGLFTERTLEEKFYVGHIIQPL